MRLYCDPKWIETRFVRAAVDGIFSSMSGVSQQKAKVSIFFFPQQGARELTLHSWRVTNGANGVQVSRFRATSESCVSGELIHTVSGRHGARDDWNQVFFPWISEDQVKKGRRNIGKKKRTAEVAAAAVDEEKSGFSRSRTQFWKCFFASFSRLKQKICVFYVDFFRWCALTRKEPGWAYQGAKCSNEWRFSTEEIKVLLCSFSGWCAFGAPCLSVDVDRSRCKWFMRRNERKELATAKNGLTRILEWFSRAQATARSNFGSRVSLLFFRGMLVNVWVNA